MTAPTAPVQVILVPFEVGSPKDARQVKPRFQPRPAQPSWRPAQHPPQVDRSELRRRVELMREAHKGQIEAMKAAGLAMLANLRAA